MQMLHFGYNVPIEILLTTDTQMANDILQEYHKTYGHNYIEPPIIIERIAGHRRDFLFFRFVITSLRTIATNVPQVLIATSSQLPIFIGLYS